jgi:undecaprenyl diphosphate synthase
VSAQGSQSARARYVAIISDGSGRWAHSRGLPITDGQAAAAFTVVARTLDAVALGIQQLTVYAFSTENWARPREEVESLISVIVRHVRKNVPLLHHEGVRIRCIGRREHVPPQLLREFERSEVLTDANRRMTLFVAFNYGGRAEIVDAARQFTGSTEEEFRRCLYAPDMHYPDLLVRTGKEQRLSNYLLWQAAYAELIFRDELWPDFTRRVFDETLQQFGARRRRFGER